MFRGDADNGLTHLNRAPARPFSIGVAGQAANEAPDAGDRFDMSSVSTEHIANTPGVCGGRPCIAGHRIRVMDIAVLHEKRGLSPAEIVHQYPGITLADVHAALTYYLDHRQEIEDEFRQDEEAVQQLLAYRPSKVAAKLNG